MLDNVLQALYEQAAKPGYRTTEFWRGVILKGLAVAAVLFHKDLTGTATWVPTAAVVVAGLETAVYTVGRVVLKKNAVNATGPVATTVVTAETSGPVDPSRAGSESVSGI